MPSPPLHLDFDTSLNRGPAIYNMLMGVGIIYVWTCGCVRMKLHCMLYLKREDDVKLVSHEYALLRF